MFHYKYTVYVWCLDRGSYFEDFSSEGELQTIILIKVPLFRGKTLTHTDVDCDAALKSVIVVCSTVISLCKCFGQQVAFEREEEEAEIWRKPECV